ncbi:MAG: RNA pyrophosphohydrolase [Coxiella sp. RIFCSPHIGHO2_12_FULL_44_14]|nr:MAG: RNA pyrophosphohydrolase [Coxiella sp. RIFCSPHIGHO2_12_FULL_44_14]
MKESLVSSAIVDQQGYRLNVGLVIVNRKGQLWWGRRVGTEEAWQFPQGGLQPQETLQDALYRELVEELGLPADAVACLGKTKRWLRYRLPTSFRSSDAHYVGQKQRWFLLRLLADETAISLNQTDYPEFDQWCWVDYWYPLQHVIAFKRSVYRAVLTEFESQVGAEC